MFRVFFWYFLERLVRFPTHLLMAPIRAAEQQAEKQDDDDQAGAHVKIQGTGFEAF